MKNESQENAEKVNKTNETKAKEEQAGEISRDKAIEMLGQYIRDRNDYRMTILDDDDEQYSNVTQEIISLFRVMADIYKMDEDVTFRVKEFKQTCYEKEREYDYKEREFKQKEREMNMRYESEKRRQNVDIFMTIAKVVCTAATVGAPFAAVCLGYHSDTHNYSFPQSSAFKNAEKWLFNVKPPQI